MFVVTSTCDPDRLAALAQRVTAHGVRLIEMPISGTSVQVARGDGVGLTGGDLDAIGQAKPVLEAICPKLHYLGEVGNGSRAKLAVNLTLGLIARRSRKVSSSARVSDSIRWLFSKS